MKHVFNVDSSWAHEICSSAFQESLCQRAQSFFQLQEQVDFDLSNSNTESFQLGHLLTDLSDLSKFLDLKLDYSHPQGNMGLLDAVCSLYETIRPEEVLIEAGSEEGLLILLQCLLNAEDHLIIQFPCYPPVLEITVSRLERNISLWQAHSEGGWHWDLKDLEKLVQPHTRAIFLCNPHNPTGALLAAEELDRIIEFAREHQLLLICDEVYRFLEYEPSKRVKPVCELYEDGISIGSLSKAFGLPGLRTGWVITRNEEIRHRLISYKSRTTLCNSVLTQHMAEMALRQSDRIREVTYQRVMANARMLEAFMQMHTDMLEWNPPQAGTVGFIALNVSNPDLPDMETFCRTMATEVGVLCLPGSFFCYPGSLFRLGFGKERFSKALQALDIFLQGQRGVWMSSQYAIV